MTDEIKTIEQSKSKIQEENNKSMEKLEEVLRGK